MARSPKLVAAGAVVLRESDGRTEVLVVHRPAYDDWSLPKGKQEPDEDLPVVAAREVAEETGITIRLAHPLGKQRYEVGHRMKTVHWWLAVPTGGELQAEGTPPRDGAQEVDQARWVEVEEARSLLSHPAEVGLVSTALEADPGHVVLLVRHGKAMLRKNWSGKDSKRPLSGRGRRQSRRLALLLEAYGVRQAVSSSSTRCVQTLAPFCERAGVELDRREELSEESWEASHRRAREAMDELVARAAANPGAPMAICGHRPLLPMMRQRLGLAPASMLAGETAIIHHDSTGSVTRVQTIKSAF